MGLEEIARERARGAYPGDRLAWSQSGANFVRQWRGDVCLLVAPRASWWTANVIVGGCVVHTSEADGANEAMLAAESAAHVATYLRRFEPVPVATNSPGERDPLVPVES